MKRSVLMIVVTLLSLQYSVYSQSMGKGKSVFYIGVGGPHAYVGAGKFRGVGYSYITTPSLHLGFERGISEGIPQSTIGLGGHLFVWTGNASYRDSHGYGYNNSWTSVTALFRGFYHHKFLVGEKWDVYATLCAGIRYWAYSYNYNDSRYAIDPYGYTSVLPATGVSIGGRYYVGKSFGFYAEVSQGYNVDYAQVGFAFKF